MILALAFTDDGSFQGAFEIDIYPNFRSFGTSIYAKGLEVPPILS